MNEAFYIGRMIIVNLDARIKAAFELLSQVWYMKISSISGINSVNFTVMFNHVTAINYE